MTDINFDWRAECAAQAKYWHGACECRLDEDLGEHTQMCDYHRDMERQLRRYKAALHVIQQWDCLNPPRTDMFGDAKWLRKIVDDALTPSTSAAESK